jgi:hypothetical protein
MKKYAIQPEREGYTRYSATLEAFRNEFEDNNSEAFEFEDLEDAIVEAGMVAKNRRGKVLIIEKVNMTNGWCRGLGWVWPDGEYCAGV